MAKYDLDKVIGLLVFLFTTFGLVQLYSASYIYSAEYYGTGSFFFLKQLIFSIIAFIVLFITYKIPWSFWEKTGIYLFVLSIVLIALTYVPGLGFSAGGARRWLKTPFFFRIEPGELFKASLPFLIAFFIAHKDQFLKRKKLPVRVLALLIPSVLLLKQPDFGSFFISCLIVSTCFFVFGLKWRWVFFSATSLSLATLALIITSPYRYERVRVFFDPWLAPLDEGFQVIQSFLSFSLGGFWGVGLGNGQSKLFFLPEAHTDFIFSVFAEEWGFVGVVIALSFLLLFIYVGFKIVEKTKDHFKKAVALGIILNFSFTALINVGVVTGLLPTKGLVFPFLSYGGSSLISFCWSMGVLMCIERHNKIELDQRQAKMI